ncbi:MAG: Gldg family protein [candidate division Zixibacteria bacterium]|nr:Gldg family protein [candidate division Zixibacteria bacterium]
MKRRFKYGLSSTALIFLVLAVLLLINLISVNLFSRLDLSGGRVFSLSKTSKDIVRNLDDKVIVKMYFSEDLPQPYNTNFRYIKDKLEEYKAYAKGNLKLELIDPIKENKELEAQGYGIPPMQVNVMEQDKLEIKKVYMGLVFLYENKKAVLPVVQSLSGLEYEFSRTIKKISSSSTPVIGFLTGHDEAALEKDLTYLNSALSKEYTTRGINLLDRQSVPADISCLLIVGPKKPFSELEKYALDQYVMKGGKLGIFLDKTDIDLEAGKADRLDLNLDDLLESYGIKVNDDLVVDMQCSRITIRQQSGHMTYSNIVNYPFFPVATAFNRENLIVKGLENVDFSFVSSLDSNYAAKRNLLFIPLVMSSANSGSQIYPYNINPFRKFDKADFSKGNLILGAVVQGRFKSHYKDIGIPQAGEDSVWSEIPESTLTQSPENRLVVIGDADFLKDRSLSKSNLVFFMNIVDWLSQDENLIDIRSKEVTTRPLKEISEGKKKLIKYANILGLPAVVVLFGFLRWRIRKQGKIKQL